MHTIMAWLTITRLDCKSRITSGDIELSFHNEILYIALKFPPGVYVLPYIQNKFYPSPMALHRVL